MNDKSYNMKKRYIIQDLISKDYFWDYRSCNGFTSELWEVKYFDSIKEAEEIIKENYNAVFSDKKLIIIPIYESLD